MTLTIDLPEEEITRLNARASAEGPRSNSVLKSFSRRRFNRLPDGHCLLESGKSGATCPTKYARSCRPERKLPPWVTRMSRS
jgi:hypothetical protein